MEFLQTNQKPEKNRGNKLLRSSIVLLASLAFSVGCAPETQAHGRILRVPGVCIEPLSSGVASVEFLGRGSQRLQLSSSDPGALAGFQVEGLSKLPIEDLEFFTVAFQPPGNGLADFFLKVETEDNKVQFFTLGTQTADPTIPEIPTEPGRGDGVVARLSPKHLLVNNSVLTKEDKIYRLKFWLAARADGNVQKIQTDQVSFNSGEVPLLLEQLPNCELFFF